MTAQPAQVDGIAARVLALLADGEVRGSWDLADRLGVPRRQILRVLRGIPEVEVRHQERVGGRSAGCPLVRRRALEPAATARAAQTGSAVLRSRILAWLDEHAGPRTNRELATALGVSVRSTWDAVRLLEADGEVLVHRGRPVRVELG